ncbi:MAG: serine acetyltransferase [Planctomycetaceae bacterium]|nr:serine acetyltransferase [Planctomycetaceae bacterium]
METVKEIVRDVRRVLFPTVNCTIGDGMLADPARASTDNTDAATLLARIHTRLQTESWRAISHVQQASLRLVSADGTCNASQPICSRTIADEFLKQLPALQATLQTDVEAAFNGDPAARSQEEILLCYPGIEAITVYRIAHLLHQLRVPYIPRMMTEWAHRETGIDIHPGAAIGSSFFIDHGTGVVIGETCVIGSGVTLYQGVTLGAWSFPRDDDGNLIRGTKRHPTLEDNVTVYSNATILGGTTVVGAGSQIGSSVSLNRSVPPNTIVTIERPSLRFREVG